eukprot:3315260-Prymnesium_polylepis.1
MATRDDLRTVSQYTIEADTVARLKAAARGPPTVLFVRGGPGPACSARERADILSMGPPPHTPPRHALRKG